MIIRSSTCQFIIRLRVDLLDNLGSGRKLSPRGLGVTNDPNDFIYLNNRKYMRSFEKGREETIRRKVNLRNMRMESLNGEESERKYF